MADGAKIIGWTNVGKEARIRTEGARDDGAKKIVWTDVLSRYMASKSRVAKGTEGTYGHAYL